MGRKKIDRKLITSSYQRLKRIKLVSQDLGISEKTVKNALKELGVKTTPVEFRNRKYVVDDDFFNNINTHAKAYVLGFICGDGNIVSRKYNYQWRVEVSSADEEVLVNILKMINSTHPIKRRIRISAFDKNKRLKSSRIEIPRKVMVQDLLKLGLTENKTKDLDFPNIRVDLYNSFILGLSDSDGGVWGKSWGFMGTQNMCLGVKRAIKDSLSIDCHMYKYNCYKIPLFRLNVFRKMDLVNLKDFLYQDHDNQLCLSRKLSSFIKLVE